MSSKNPIEALEETNSRYIELLRYEAPEYILGRRIFHFIKSFPLHTIQLICNFVRVRKKEQLCEEISHYVELEDFFYKSPLPINNKKGVVYSCITNGYDKPIEPVLLNESLDYIMYTDIEQVYGSSWEHRQLSEVKNISGSNFANRYFKLNPFDLFQIYDYSIYADGNVQLVSDVTGLYSIAQKSPLGIAMHKHYARKCAYEDAKWCELNKRGISPAIIKQMEKYRREGFPVDFGLCEATIIVVDLHNETARKVMSAWWDEFCRSGSGRDQLSFPYVLWKMGYKISDVGCLGNDEYRNPKFIINEHKGKLI